jgi:tetrahydromethanopterin S-methyltransferase subunit G
MDTPITRAEFMQYVKAQNGSLGRIEKKLEDIERRLEKMDDAENACRQEVDHRIGVLEGRLISSRITGLIIGILSSAVIGLTVVLVTHALK